MTILLPDLSYHYIYNNADLDENSLIYNIYKLLKISHYCYK